MVQANLLAATTDHPAALCEVFNVAFGERTTLNQLFALIRDRVSRIAPSAGALRPAYGEFRPGDVRHSLADISRARARLGYVPEYSVAEGLDLATEWYASVSRASVRPDR